MTRVHPSVLPAVRHALVRILPLALAACRLSAFDDVVGDPLVDGGGSATIRDGGVSDAGVPGDCARPESLPLSLTNADVVQLATLGEPEGVTFRVPGPSAWLGAHRLYLFSSTVTHVSEAGQASYASASLEGAHAPWRVDRPEVEPWFLADVLDPQGLPRPLLPAPAPDAGFVLSPTGLIRTRSGENGGTVFLVKVGADLAAQEVWLAHIADGQTVASDVVGPLFSGNEPLFAHGAFRGNEYVKVFACERDPTITDANDLRYTRCFVARVPVDAVETRTAYEVYRAEGDGTGVWDAELSRATPVLFGAQGGLSLGWSNYLNGFVAVHGKPLSNKLVVQTAKLPEGPWTVQGELLLPAASQGIVLAPTLHSGLGGCDDHLVVSYLAPSELEGITPRAGQVQFVSIDLR